MSKKNPRVSINQLESIYENIEESVEIGEGIYAHIKYIIGMDEMLSLVYSIVDACINKEDSEYLPEAKDFFTRCGIIKAYTNIALPQDVKKMYTLLYGTKIYDIVCKHISNSQFYVISQAIDKKIEYLCEKMQSECRREIEDLAAKCDRLLSLAQDTFGNVDMTDLAKNISEMPKWDVNDVVSAVKRVRQPDEVIDTVEAKYPGLIREIPNEE